MIRRYLNYLNQFKNTNTLNTFPAWWETIEPNPVTIIHDIFAEYLGPHPGPPLHSGSLWPGESPAGVGCSWSQPGSHSGSMTPRWQAQHWGLEPPPRQGTLLQSQSHCTGNITNTNYYNMKLTIIICISMIFHLLWNKLRGCHLSSHVNC